MPVLHAVIFVSLFFHGISAMQYDVQQLMKFVDSIEPPAVAGESVGYVVSPPIPDRLQSSSQSPTVSAHVIDVCVRLLFRFVDCYRTLLLLIAEHSFSPMRWSWEGML